MIMEYRTLCVDEINTALFGGFIRRQVVEKCSKQELFREPLHPYTQALLAAIPIPKLSSRGVEREILQGEIKSPINPKNECRFAGRCKYAMEECRCGVPELREVRPGHFVACFNRK